MKQIRVSVVLLAAGCVVGITSQRAIAQDLFELEVFEYATTPADRYDVELHTNVLSRNTASEDSIAGNHRPAHVSVEITRGWTDRFEAALFLQTAPFGSSGSTRFAGGHLRGKLRVGDLAVIPLRLALSAEYTFNRAAFDRELQTLELRTILDYTRGRLSLVANPSLELVTRGVEGLAPIFDLSARASWAVVRRVSLTSDYFSAAATTRHLQPAPGAHHLLFGGVDLDVGSGWKFGVSAGHCVTSGEPWLMKSTLGYSF